MAYIKLALTFLGFFAKPTVATITKSLTTVVSDLEDHVASKLEEVIHHSDVEAKALVAKAAANAEVEAARKVAANIRALVA